MRIVLLILFIFPIVVRSEFLDQNESKKRAYFFYLRITGVIPDVDSDEFADVYNLIESGDEENAALLIANDKNLINVKLKNFLKDWTNRKVSKNVSSSDMLLLMLGLIRDDRDFREVLTTNKIYKISYDGFKYTFPPSGDIAKKPGEIEQYLSYMGAPDNLSFNEITDKAKYNRGNIYEGSVYLNIDNGHIDLNKYLVEENRIVKYDDFTTSDHVNFTLKDSSNTLRENGFISGVITTDQFAAEFFNAGTNRRATQYLFKNFLCKEFDDVADTTVDTQYIRRDVDRYPNGDSKVYLNYCIGCHAGQDSLGRAFYHYDKSLVYNGMIYRKEHSFSPSTPNKLNKNIVYEDGFVVGTDKNGNSVDRKDVWENLWISGKNEELGMPDETVWKSSILDTGEAHKGAGVKELGEYLSLSTAFDECMAERMWEMVCVNRKDSVFESKRKELGGFFRNNNHNMKKLIAKIATFCPYDSEL